VASKLWSELTPTEIIGLDPEQTVGVLLLGSTGSLDEGTPIGDDLEVLKQAAEILVLDIEEDETGPLKDFQVIRVGPLWMGPEPGADTPGAINLPLDQWQSLVLEICLNLQRNRIKYIVLFTRDDRILDACSPVAEKLTGDDLKVLAYNPLHQNLDFTRWGDACRAFCAVFGFDGSGCPA
jgi:hypothetical protein